MATQGHAAGEPIAASPHRQAASASTPNRSHSDLSYRLRVSKTAGAKARRVEEIAFLIMEHALGVDIHLADAGAGNKKPDGAWGYPDQNGRRGIVEVNSPSSYLAGATGSSPTSTAFRTSSPTARPRPWVT